jgi:predicted transcriptional regulator
MTRHIPIPKGKPLVKKIPFSIVDKLTKSEEKRLQLILDIQRMYKDGIGISEISRRLGINRHTVKKYTEGDPETLCRSNKRSALDQYKDCIIQLLNDGMTQTETVRKVMELTNSTYGESNLRNYVGSVITQYGLVVNKYTSTQKTDNGSASKNLKTVYITRKGIFNYLWMGGPLSKEHHDILWDKYDVLWEVETCIKEFREIFSTRRMPLLYLFIEKYKDSEIKELASFAKGLERDISAVENAVASDLSSGFVEGTNNKIKMVKRAMYGRCGRKLLEAKLMYSPKQK